MPSTRSKYDQGVNKGLISTHTKKRGHTMVQPCITKFCQPNGSAT
jgi:hypothetical protein